MQDHRSACNSAFWSRACLRCDGPHLAFISHISSEDNPVHGNEPEVRSQSPFKKPSNVMIAATVHCQTRRHQSRVTFAVGARFGCVLDVSFASSLHEITYSQHTIKCWFPDMQTIKAGIWCLSSVISKPSFSFHTSWAGLDPKEHEYVTWQNLG